jgi:hypothetical protein
MYVSAIGMYYNRVLYSIRLFGKNPKKDTKVDMMKEEGGRWKVIFLKRYSIGN